LVFFRTLSAGNGLPGETSSLDTNKADAHSVKQNSPKKRIADAVVRTSYGFAAGDVGF